MQSLCWQTRTTSVLSILSLCLNGTCFAQQSATGSAAENQSDKYLMKIEGSAVNSKGGLAAQGTGRALLPGNKVVNSGTIDAIEKNTITINNEVFKIGRKTKICDDEGKRTTYIKLKAGTNGLVIAAKGSQDADVIRANLVAIGLMGGGVVEETLKCE